MEKNCLIWMPNTKCSFILRGDHWSSSAILETHDLPFSNRTMGRSRSPIIASGRSKHNGRDPFNQKFRKFWSKTEWIGSVRSKWTVPFDHSDPFSIPGPRCLVSSMYKMEKNTYHCTFMDC